MQQMIRRIGLTAVLAAGLATPALAADVDVYHDKANWQDAYTSVLGNAPASTEAGLPLSLQVNRDLFEPLTAERLLEALGNLLGAMAEDPGSRVSAARLLEEAELRQLLGRTSPPQVKSVPQEKTDSGALPLAPGGEAGRMVAEIWQELLGIERVGVDDHFYWCQQRP